MIGLCLLEHVSASHHMAKGGSHLLLFLRHDISPHLMEGVWSMARWLWMCRTAAVLFSENSPQLTLVDGVATIVGAVECYYDVLVWHTKACDNNFVLSHRIFAFSHCGICRL